MKTMICSFILLFTFTICAQTGKLTGKVTEKGSGKPVLGANIFLKGTAKGAATINEGTYFITKIPAGSYEVHISCPGFESKAVKDVSIKDGLISNLDIELKFADESSELPSEFEKEYLKALPESIEELLSELKKIDKNKYPRIISQAFLSLRANNDNKTEHVKIIELDIQSELLGSRYKSAPESKRSGIKNQLHSTLKQLFRARENERKNHIARLEQELGSLKESLEHIKKEEDTLIENRLKELTR